MCYQTKPFLKLKHRVAYSKKLDLKNPKGFNEKLPNQFVIKCTHDRGGLVVCKDKNKLDIGVIGKGTGHAEEYSRNVYDEKFNLLSVLKTRENYPIKVNKPKNFEKMIEIAEKLSYGLPHVRVDLYNIEGAIFSVK